ncbi:hypothetical protein J6590_044247 [Homalodisca vitripennis]|nr:hypothetical protein J6590_044247 [Homalodisca vitripennis]
MARATKTVQGRSPDRICQRPPPELWPRHSVTTVRAINVGDNTSTSLYNQQLPLPARYYTATFPSSFQRVLDVTMATLERLHLSQ